MELRHLRYFVAVVQEGNFTRAAKHLHIAQPPLSRQIQQLETSLGVLLLERRSRPLRPTDAGQLFYEHALGILDRVEVLTIMTKRRGQLEGGGSASGSSVRPFTVHCRIWSDVSVPPTRKCACSSWSSPACSRSPR